MGGDAQDAFQTMMQSLQGGFPGSGSGAGFTGMFGEGSADGAGSMFPPGFPDPTALGGGLGGAQDVAYSGVKTRFDRLFTLAHFLGVLGLVAFVLGWWEPQVRQKRAESGFVGEWERGNIGWNGKGVGVELVSSCYLFAFWPWLFC